MKALFTDLRAAVVSTLVLALVCCGLYPLAVWGIAQAAFHDKANGSLVTDAKGSIIGSRLLGQNFTGPGYFHPRPSAAGMGYDAISSSGTNLGPTSQKLADAIKSSIAAYRAENGLKDGDPVPADAVTASGSGLDPHISQANARLQAARVARVRALPFEKVMEAVTAQTENPDFGILGEVRVNVLMLNRALDELK